MLYDHDFELLWTAINGPGPRERVQFFNFFGRPQVTTFLNLDERCFFACSHLGMPVVSSSVNGMLMSGNSNDLLFDNFPSKRVVFFLTSSAFS